MGKAEPVVGEAPGATRTVAVQKARIHVHGLRDEAAIDFFGSRPACPAAYRPHPAAGRPKKPGTGLAVDT
jgi:hypothetical protein